MQGGGHAVGARIVGGYRATEPMRCGCCQCRIGRGQMVFEALTADELLEVCIECVGEP
jgi:hypothetical protein